MTRPPPVLPTHMIQCMMMRAARRYVNSRLGSDFLSARPSVRPSVRQSAASVCLGLREGRHSRQAGRQESHGLFSCHCEDHTNEEEEEEGILGLFGDCGASVYLSRCYDDDEDALLLMGIAPVWGQKRQTEFKSASLSLVRFSPYFFLSLFLGGGRRCLEMPPNLDKV